MRHQRLLVGADHRHDAKAADAVLHRGQSLRNLGPVELPDARRRHRRQFGELRQSARSSPATAPIPPRRRGCLTAAVGHVRGHAGPALLRLTVPRLQGHSFQDTQTYKAEEYVASEWARDPLPKLKAHLVGAVMDEAEWETIAADAEAAVEAARDRSRGARSGRARERHRPCLLRRRDAAARRPVDARAIAPRARPRRRGPKASGSTW